MLKVQLRAKTKFCNQPDEKQPLCLQLGQGAGFPASLAWGYYMLNGIIGHYQCYSVSVKEPRSVEPLGLRE